MLTSILDPNAEIREGFVNYNVTTKDRRSLGGFLTDNDPAVVTLRGFDGQDVRVPREQIADMKAERRSLMPEGLLDGLSDAELRASEEILHERDRHRWDLESHAREDRQP